MFASAVASLGLGPGPGLAAALRLRATVLQDRPLWHSFGSLSSQGAQQTEQTLPLQLEHKARRPKALELTPFDLTLPMTCSASWGLSEDMMARHGGKGQEQRSSPGIAF